MVAAGGAARHRRPAAAGTIPLAAGTGRPAGASNL
jgi:hypothetical protein